MTFTKNEVWECYQFARQMRGKHNRSMIMDRDDWEIFRDDLRGKLGEIALRNYIMKNIPNANIESNIDFSVTPLGQWDITDLIVNGKYINVKSVKGNSRFLLIETKRYDPDGSYAYRNNDGMPVRVDAYVLVRVTIEPEIDCMDMNYKNVKEFRCSKGGRSIEAEILGGISHEEFWRKKHFAPKNMKCNYANLSAVCKGKTVEMIYEGSKTARLQRDNYVLDSRTELKDIREIL